MLYSNGICRASEVSQQLHFCVSHQAKKTPVGPMSFHDIHSETGAERMPAFGSRTLQMAVTCLAMGTLTAFFDGGGSHKEQLPQWGVMSQCLLSPANQQAVGSAMQTDSRQARNAS
jgi:hypothetical protein